MGGKKIDRKKQSLLSRSAKRQASIKKLTHKPVIKHVDIEAIKESFKHSTPAHSSKKESKAEVTTEKSDVEAMNPEKPKRSPKASKEKES